MISPFAVSTFRVTQAFSKGLHDGMDIVGVGSSAVVAVGDGVIEAAVEHNAHYSSPLTVNRTREWGCYIKLRLSDGNIVYYCHMRPGTFKVTAGQTVGKGQELGEMGNTGYSFGAHLHIEVRSSGNRVTDEINTPALLGIPNNCGSYSAEKGDGMTTAERKEIDELKKELAELKADYDSRVRIKWNYIDGNMPAWARQSISKIYKRGFLKGDEHNHLSLSYLELRLLTILARAIR